MERVQVGPLSDVSASSTAGGALVDAGRGPSRPASRPSDEVRLNGVSKRYPGSDVAAVEDLNLVIPPGEFFSLLGPSGSGKTTTLRLIAGFEAPTSGTVHLGDRDITDLPPFRRPVHTVFQSYALFPHMNVHQNVAYPLRMRRLEKAQIGPAVDGILDRVAVRQFADRMPHQLSGGQRQRVALARALVAHPQVVLLDEPLGALDLKLREEMQIVLQHLQREVGITFIYVTHDQGEALAMSDRIAILADGRLHQVATPTEVYSRPETAFVAGFVGRTNLLECHAAGPGRARAGDLPLAVPAEVPGSRFVLSVRPEALHLGPAAENCDNRVEGVLREAIYHGREVELRIAVGSHLLVARSPVGAWIVGDGLAVGWNVGDAVAVRTEPEAEPEVVQ
jgi:ABC-type Fe3+/spermidine/putrescine transport system ATPase subunit